MRLHTVMLFAALILAPEAPADTSVRVTRLDGSALDGRLNAINGETITLTADGGSESILLADLQRIDFATRPNARPSEGSWRLLLADSGRVYGELVEPRDESLVIDTSYAKALRFGFDRIAALARADDGSDGRSRALFAEAKKHRVRDSDVLITRDDEPKALRGTLLNLGPEQGAFVFADRQRTLRTDKLYGVVFATGLQRHKPATALLHLHVGDVLSGRITGLETDRLLFATADGQQLALTLDAIDEVVLRSDRVVYLSDLQAVSFDGGGVVHGQWIYRADRNAGNQPIRLAGKQYAKGIGVHANARIEYDLDGRYQTFAARIGIDDQVRPAGSVRFRVLADGNEVFASDVLTGQDAPRDVAVPVAGAMHMTLIVEMADGLDLADWADWAQARLIKAHASG